MSKSRINRGIARRAELQNRASIIAEERAKRSPKEQLTLLDQRLGKDAGASKERRRLHLMIESLEEKKRSKNALKEKRDEKSSQGKKPRAKKRS